MLMKKIRFIIFYSFLSFLQYYLRIKVSREALLWLPRVPRFFFFLSSGKQTENKRGEKRCRRRLINTDFVYGFFVVRKYPPSSYYWWQSGCNDYFLTLPRLSNFYVPILIYQQRDDSRKILATLKLKCFFLFISSEKNVKLIIL